MAELRSLLLAAEPRAVALLPPSDGAALEAAAALLERFQAAETQRCHMTLCASESPSGPQKQSVALPFAAASRMLPASLNVSLRPIPGGKRPLRIGAVHAAIVYGALVADEPEGEVKRARLVTGAPWRLGEFKALIAKKGLPARFVPAEAGQALEVGGPGEGVHVSVRRDASGVGVRLDGVAGPEYFAARLEMYKNAAVV